MEDLSAQLGTLNQQFSVNTAEQQDLKSKADLMEKRLDAASRLISGLGSEHERWTKELEELGVARIKLLGDCLVSSSFLRFVLSVLLVYIAKIIFESNSQSVIT